MREWLKREEAKRLLWINSELAELPEEAIPSCFNELRMFGLRNVPGIGEDNNVGIGKFLGEPVCVLGGH